MEELANTYFVAFTSLMLCFTYLASILIKVQTGAVLVEYSIGFTPISVLAILLSTSIAVLVVGFFLLLHDIRSESEQRSIKYKHDGKKVAVRKLPHGSFHVFLSHSQQYGADQVATIKYLLEQFVENISCFLGGLLHDLSISL